MNNKELLKELRCLRMDLSPYFNPQKLAVIEEAERRLKDPGAVSTALPPSPFKKQGRRTTKRDIYNKYFNR